MARDGRILTTGCNEVPRAGGGQFWCDSDDDKRDFQIGYDVNDRRKREAIVELLENLNDQFDEDKVPFTSGEYDAGKHYDKLLEQEKKLGATRFSGTRVDSMIEYGRALHADMSAITNAALSTISIHDCDVYSITFPCHLCARFILGAGIRNVFYIEPYPKSAVPELYSDSIVLDPTLSPEEYKDRLTGSALLVHRVFFIPFEGVAPRRYPDLFSFEPKTRKNEDGSIVEINPMKATPRQTPKLCDPTSEAEKAVVPKIEDLIAQMNAPEEQSEHANGAPAHSGGENDDDSTRLVEREEFKRKAHATHRTAFRSLGLPETVSYVADKGESCGLMSPGFSPETHALRLPKFTTSGHTVGTARFSGFNDTVAGQRCELYNQPDRLDRVMRAKGLL